MVKIKLCSLFNICNANYKSNWFCNKKRTKVHCNIYINFIKFIKDEIKNDKH